MAVQLEYTAMGSSSWQVVMPMPGLQLNNWKHPKHPTTNISQKKWNSCFCSIRSAMFMKIRLLNLTLKFFKSPWGASHVLRCTLAQAGPIKLHGGAAQMNALSLSLRDHKMTTKCLPRAQTLQNGVHIFKKYREYIQNPVQNKMQTACQETVLPWKATLSYQSLCIYRECVKSSHHTPQTDIRLWTKFWQPVPMHRRGQDSAKFGQIAWHSAQGNAQVLLHDLLHGTTWAMASTNSNGLTKIYKPHGAVCECLQNGNAHV